MAGGCIRWIRSRRWRFSKFLIPSLTATKFLYANSFLALDHFFCCFLEGHAGGNERVCCFLPHAFGLFFPPSLYHQSGTAVHYFSAASYLLITCCCVVPPFLL